jgi:hypothetical protein
MLERTERELNGIAGQSSRAMWAGTALQLCQSDSQKTSSEMMERRPSHLASSQLGFASDSPGRERSICIVTGLPLTFIPTSLDVAVKRIR